MQYKNVEKLIINRLTQEQYDALKEAGTLQDDELYMTPSGGIIDNLTSESATDALSAKQGRILKEMIASAEGTVRDVQINGTTILDEDGIANIGIVDNLNSTETAKALSANQGRALNGALSSKANLENGKVPLSELPEFVIADVVEVETYSALPAQGQSGVVYYTKDDGKSYRWVGSQYVEISQRANYYSLEVGTSTSTMGQLRTLINNVNTAGDHVFLDLHSYLTDGYVCTVHMYTENNVNYCQILDLLYHRVIFDPNGYSDSTLISTYCSTASNIWVSPRDVRMNGVSLIENEIAMIPTILNTTTFSCEMVDGTTKTLTINGTLT